MTSKGLSTQQSLEPTWSQSRGQSRGQSRVQSRGQSRVYDPIDSLWGSGSIGEMDMFGSDLIAICGARMMKPTRRALRIHHDGHRGRCIAQPEGGKYRPSADDILGVLHRKRRECKPPANLLLAPRVDGAHWRVGVSEVDGDRIACPSQPEGRHLGVAQRGEVAARPVRGELHEGEVCVHMDVCTCACTHACM